MIGEVDAGAAIDYANNTGKTLQIEGKLSILVCRTDGGFYAVENRCSHQLQELAGGTIKKFFIYCPVHGARFDLRDGSPSGALTKKPIRTFPVREEGGRVIVTLLEHRLSSGGTSTNRLL